MEDVLIASVLKRLQARLADHLDDVETKVLDVVIDFYQFCFRKRMEENPSAVLKDLSEFFEEDGK